MRFVHFAAMLHHIENALLQVAHDGVGPERGVGVEVGAEPFLAAEVEKDRSIGKRLKPVLAVEDIEEASADGYMVVQRVGRDVFRVCRDGESDALAGFPTGDGLDKE